MVENMNKPQCVWETKSELGEGAIWIESEQALLHRYEPAIRAGFCFPAYTSNSSNT